MRKINVKYTWQVMYWQVRSLAMHFSNSKEYRIFDPFGLQYAFYTPPINSFIENSGKTFIKSNNEFLNIYVDNPRLKNFLAKNKPSYLYNIDFSALRIKCSKNICKLVY